MLKNKGNKVFFLTRISFLSPSEVYHVILPWQNVSQPNISCSMICQNQDFEILSLRNVKCSTSNIYQSSKWGVYWVKLYIV